MRRLRAHVLAAVMLGSGAWACNNTGDSAKAANAADSGTPASDSGGGGDAASTTPICLGTAPPGVEHVAEFVASGFYGAFVDGKDFFFSAPYSDGADLTRIYHYDLSIGGAVPVEGEPSPWFSEVWNGRGSAQGLVPHGSDLFWLQDPSESISMPAPRSSHELLRVARTGGASNTVVPPGDFDGLAEVPQGLVLVHYDNSVQLLPWGASTATDVCTPEVMVHWSANADWLVTQGSKGLQGCPLTGGPVTTLSTIDAYAEEMVLDATHAYFAGPEGIRRVKLGGGMPEPAIETVTTESAFSMAIDGDTILFASKGAIRRVSTSGGTSTALGAEVDGAFWIGHDDSYVYWATHEDTYLGCLKRAKKS